AFDFQPSAYWGEDVIKNNIKAVPCSSNLNNLKEIKRKTNKILASWSPINGQMSQWQARNTSLLNRLLFRIDKRVKELEIIQNIKTIKNQIQDKIDTDILPALTGITETKLIANTKELKTAQKCKETYLKKRKAYEESLSLLQVFIDDAETNAGAKKLVSDNDEALVSFDSASEEKQPAKEEISIPKSPWNLKQIKQLEADIKKSNANISDVLPSICAEKARCIHQVIVVVEKLQWSCRLVKLLEKENECLVALRNKLSVNLELFIKTYSFTRIHFDEKELPQIGF
ncbi:MAG TPA: hypothetical protein PLC42_07745, partial [Parachlamydiaceae bacterium]|nr:hypothetical protein [Parachlamydiaceae bacterium]